jgi:Spermine/spermidine synthase domain
MGRSYVGLLTLAVTGSVLAPLITIFGSRYLEDGTLPWLQLPVYALIALVIISLGLVFRWGLERLQTRSDRAAADQAAYILHDMPEKWIGPAIIAAAAVSLFLELSIIRWQATVFPFFSFYKNLSLLSCFAGLGLGYATSKSNRIPLFLTLPLLCWQFLLMLAMRYGMSYQQVQSLYVLPFREQLNMGYRHIGEYYQGLQSYFVLSVIFLLTALTFLPIGQLCGCLMERREKLEAYGLNLLGSLAGVLLMFLVSAFWTPPTVWFLIVFAILIPFQARKKGVLALAATSALAGLLILEWPVNPGWQRIYSPYQLLEVGHGEHGLMEIRAAGHYYQRVYDFLAPSDSSDPWVGRARHYYDTPYRIVNHPKDVAIVGSGSGNDVAAALRGGAERIDAIEIDPAILMLGQDGHPEHPYQDPRVHAVNNDARSFLRTTDRKYDLIVFGLLDSHTLLSQASSVRLDSFVYTVEAMREARARLKPHGVISLTFSVLNDQIGRKIYLMLQQAFNGRAPACFKIWYDAGVIFLDSDDPLTLPPDLLKGGGFWAKSADYANPTLRADISTDDWPFFYMPARVYPVSYLVMVGLVLALSLFLIARVLPDRPQPRSLPFFLMGAGFMLVETKGITELGLTFGSSWQVIGVVIAAIMVMAFFANWVVRRIAIARLAIPYALLIASLAVGWWISKNGGLSSNWSGRIGTALLLTSPMFFSGIVFSTLLKSRGEISGAMSANLFGAMCGGLLEYNSMYFGFRFLYLMAGGLYLLAAVWDFFGVNLPRSSAAAKVSAAVAGR